MGYALALLGALLPAVQGSEVAELELGLAGPQPFVLHATLPVPPGTEHPGDGVSPFAVRTPTGEIVLAQTEVVSRYARSADGADVVELVARVPGNPGASAGDRARYDVLLQPHAQPAPPHVPTRLDLAFGPDGVPPIVQSFIAGPVSAYLYAEDVFGNIYLVDLLDGKRGRAITRYGATTAQLRMYDVLRPLLPKTGPSGTLPHLFGVHTYARTWSDEAVIGLDLRLHNGHDGYDQSDPLDDPLGAVWFRRLDVLLPTTWAVQFDVADPAQTPPLVLGAWTAWSIVAPRADGKPHYAPHQAQMSRRLVLSTAAATGRARDLLDHRGLAFARPDATGVAGTPWSWWNPATARYFPQRHRMPELGFLDSAALRGSLAAAFDVTRGYLLSGQGIGTYPVKANRLGWAHPYGVYYGGMTGGAGILLYEGVETLAGASNEGYRNHLLVHRMQSERQENVLYHRDGTPTRLELWLAGGTTNPHLPMAFYMTLLSGSSGDPFGFGSAPSFQASFVGANGLAPDYQAELDSFQPHDLEHLVRFTRTAKALVWLGNDALARDDLAMQAELARMSYIEYPSSAGGQVSSGTLLSDQLSVQANPAKGLSFGRAEGWTIDTVLAVYAGADDAWRARMRPWLDAIVQMVADGQIACSGFIQASQQPKFLDSQFRVRQAFEHSIVEHALWGLRETVYRDESPGHAALLRDVLIDALYSMISPESWSPALNGPWWHAAVGPPNVALPAYCGNQPADGHSTFIDTTQAWSSFAYGYELTNDPLFLQRASEMIGGDLYARLAQKGTNNIGNSAALVALVEQLLGP